MKSFSSQRQTSAFEIHRTLGKSRCQQQTAAMPLNLGRCIQLFPSVVLIATYVKFLLAMSPIACKAFPQRDGINRYSKKASTLVITHRQKLICSDIDGLLFNSYSVRNSTEDIFWISKAKENQGHVPSAGDPLVCDFVLTLQGPSIQSRREENGAGCPAACFLARYSLGSPASPTFTIIYIRVRKEDVPKFRRIQMDCFSENTPRPSPTNETDECPSPLRRKRAVGRKRNPVAAAFTIVEPKDTEKAAVKQALNILKRRKTFTISAANSLLRKATRVIGRRKRRRAVF